MAANFDLAFAALKRVFENYSQDLSVKIDSPTEYKLVGQVPSPFPQHKGHPLEFGVVRVGKAYVSFHLMSLHMGKAPSISPELKKRMQGKTCFNFQDAPPREMLAELQKLADAGFQDWKMKKWL
jgi:hypothetical protein